MTARKFFAVAAVAGGLVLGACGSDSYDRDELISGLVEDGTMTEAQAICVADGLEDSFSTDQLDNIEANDELSEEEQAVFVEITTDCILGG